MAWSDPGGALGRMYIQGVPNQVQYSSDRDIREKVGPYLVPVGRAAVGVALGVVLSFMGIAIAWGLFIFFGVQSLDVWLGSLYSGAGLGAGTAAFVAWLHIDRETGLVLMATAVVVVGAGIVGASCALEVGPDHDRDHDRQDRDETDTSEQTCMIHVGTSVRGR